MSLASGVVRESAALYGTGFAPFQRRWLRGTFRPAVDLSVLSVGRGNGKSWIVAHLMATATRRCPRCAASSASGR